MQDFHQLRAWQIAAELASDVVSTFSVVRAGPLCDLRDQTTSAAGSIPANLAEGCGRSSRKEFVVFIDYALGSASELEQHLGSARRSGVIDEAVLCRFVADLSRSKE